MALQLEAALRRAPMPEGRPPVTDPFAGLVAKPAEPRPAPREFKPRVEPKFEPKFDAPKAESPSEPKFESKFEPKFEPKLDIKPEPKVEAKVETKLEPLPSKNLYDNLEEEMASLLGRPSGKP